MRVKLYKDNPQKGRTCTKVNILRRFHTYLSITCIQLIVKAQHIDETYFDVLKLHILLVFC